MADGRLPDETLSQILSPALRVSDAAFSALSSNGGSPFMTFSESSSALLLVSKAWLRVATPLLYNVVVLRSKAQAQALAVALTRNPDLARFIKKLRVEGAFSEAMSTILRACKDITDLFLSLDLDRRIDDDASGLCRGLFLIDPVRLIVDAGRLDDIHRADAANRWRNWELPKSQQTMQLRQTVVECISRTWKKLAHLEIPSQLFRRMDLLNALSCAPKLKTLSILWDGNDTIGILATSFQGFHWYRELRAIARNPSLKRIRIDPLISPRFDPALDREMCRALATMARETLAKLVRHQSMKALLVLPDRVLVPATLSNRLTTLLSEEDAILSRVLYFAMCCDGMTFSSRLELILVCKTFARVGVPHLYESPVLKFKSKLESFATQLVQNPPLGSGVRCLCITLKSPFDMATFNTIIERTPALEEVRGGQGLRGITWEAFRDLGKYTGSSLRTLRDMSVGKAPEVVSPVVFARFSALRQLGWDSRTKFKTEHRRIPAGALSRLVDLTVNRFDQSFLDTLSYIELPRLLTVTFLATTRGGARFFEVHGSKLCELSLSVQHLPDSELAIWRNCPNLTVLNIFCNDGECPLSSSCLVSTEIHARLERIIFKFPADYRFRHDLHEQELGKVIKALVSTASFPALREVVHPDCRFPTTERDIASAKERKDIWAYPGGRG
ncbi:hypothetical protein C8R47DRAFT_578728 [Mycena vitilis]|nr:hypothetical protein C8R47DRAFT_578728 [Mycena vitilis]